MNIYGKREPLPVISNCLPLKGQDRCGNIGHPYHSPGLNCAIGVQDTRGALIHELGGAHVRFEPDGTIVIHGSSQQYGACDKQHAAELVRKAFAGRQVVVE